MPQFDKMLTIIAGPNGSGKTTFVQSIYPELIRDNLFLNADLLAQKLSPHDVRRSAVSAGKMFLRELGKLVSEDRSFIIETTLSGKRLLHRIAEARNNGFIVRLVFLWITSSELCDFRVKGRVASGGHNIPIEDIERRYNRGLVNFSTYLDAVDECKIYIADESPMLIFEKLYGGDITVMEHDLFNAFRTQL